MAVYRRQIGPRRLFTRQAHRQDTHREGTRKTLVDEIFNNYFMHRKRKRNRINFHFFLKFLLKPKRTFLPIQLT